MSHDTMRLNDSKHDHSLKKKIALWKNKIKEIENKKWKDYSFFLFLLDITTPAAIATTATTTIMPIMA